MNPVRNFTDQTKHNESQFSPSKLKLYSLLLFLTG